MKYQNTPQGFTLIELLVVVLIIGILVAVAIPQYQKSITKTRIAEVLPILRNIAEANERFYLANGYYTTNWDDLDIPKPKTHGCIHGYNLQNTNVNVVWNSCGEFPMLERTYEHSGHVRPGKFTCNGYGSRFRAKICADYGEPIYAWTPHYTAW